MNKMAIVSPYQSITTLNINRLNFPIKGHRMTERVFFKDAKICCLPKIHFKVTHKLTVNGWKNIFRANSSNNRKAGQKPTRYCKTVILQLKINNFFLKSRHSYT